MCWCLRVYWTVLHNLFARFVNNVANSLCNTDRVACACSSCCYNCFKHKQTKRAAELIAEAEERDVLTLERTIANFQHDYVIVDEIDANYLEIERRKIETESYYRTVDRATAEDMLICRDDGACLVRPYKEADICIKYIISIYAQQQFFHLFIRRVGGRESYGIGQEKPNEKRFSAPSDIVEFYMQNALQCTNKTTSLSLVLKPIVA